MLRYLVMDVRFLAGVSAGDPGRRVSRAGSPFGHDGGIGRGVVEAVIGERVLLKRNAREHRHTRSSEHRRSVRGSRRLLESATSAGDQRAQLVTWSVESVMGSTILRSRTRLRTPYRQVAEGYARTSTRFRRPEAVPRKWGIPADIETATAIPREPYRTGRVVFSNGDGRECGLMTYLLCAVLGVSEFSLHSSVSVSLRVLR